MSISPELYDAIQRIVDARVGEIKVTREDFNKLTATVSDLSTTVSKLSITVSDLSETVKGLSGTVRDLAEAQKRTEEELGKLARAVAGLSDRIGYGLEDIARVMLPPWLERHLGLRVGELERRFFRVEGKGLEVNLYGEGLKGKRNVVVVGEVKSTIHAADVNRFAGVVERLRRALKDRLIVPVMFGYVIYPEATKVGGKLKIHLTASYQR